MGPVDFNGRAKTKLAMLLAFSYCGEIVKNSFCCNGILHMILVTACVLNMREGNVFSLYVCGSWS